MSRKVRCPHCGKVIEYTPENPFRPFCSERCQLLDLGQWADEKYKIPTRDQQEESEAMSQDGSEQDE